MTDDWRAFASPEWPAFAGADWLARVMTAAVPDRRHAKQGRDIGRWTLSFGDRTLVVYLKRHFVLPRRLTWLARLFPRRSYSPGWQEFEHLRWAAAQGLPVPVVHAAGESRRGPLRSFLAVEELAGMLALHELIPLAAGRLSPRDFEAWKRGLVIELARLTRELHRRRAAHQDLYLCHFYARVGDIAVTPTAWAGRVVMIDFHRLTHSTWQWRRFQVKDLAQLLFSTEGVTGASPRDVLRFERAYRRADGPDWPTPPAALRRLVRWKAAQYLRHNRKLAGDLP